MIEPTPFDLVRAGGERAAGPFLIMLIILGALILWLDHQGYFERDLADGRVTPDADNKPDET